MAAGGAAHPSQGQSFGSPRAPGAHLSSPSLPQSSRHPDAQAPHDPVLLHHLAAQQLNQDLGPVRERQPENSRTNALGALRLTSSQPRRAAAFSQAKRAAHYGQQPFQREPRPIKTAIGRRKGTGQDEKLGRQMQIRQLQVQGQLLREKGQQYN